MSSWLDVMPAIPLARGVPVVTLVTASGPIAWTPFGVVIHEGPDPGTWKLSSQTSSLPEESCRVDLEDPQGFAYALHWLGCHAENPCFADEWAQHWMVGLTTTEDRLALAKACSEVMPK